MSAAAPQRRRLAVLALASALLAGCAQPPRSAADAARSDHWSGRLAVQVQDDAAARSFSAGFTLAGSAGHGAFTLYNPLGNTLAEITWTAAGARMLASDRQHEAASLHQLVQELTGTDLPVEALFGWLRGDTVQAAGWQADLSRLAEGRLVATRSTPAPPVTLRIVLER